MHAGRIAPCNSQPHKPEVRNERADCPSEQPLHGCAITTTGPAAEPPSRDEARRQLSPKMPAPVTAAHSGLRLGLCGPLNSQIRSPGVASAGAAKTSPGKWCDPFVPASLTKLIALASARRQPVATG